MKKISLKKLQISFAIAFGGLLLALVLMFLNLPQVGVVFFVLALFGVMMLLQSGQCPYCHDARSAKWVNPLGTTKEIYCTRCGKKLEFEDDGFIRMRHKK